jgi:hypothetical protein
MNFEYRFARLAACLLLAAAGAYVHAPVHAQAQQPAQAAAADPQATVPPTRYQSALDYRRPAAPTTSPDRNWVASNQTVAAANSMALTMKPMAGDAGHAQHDHAAMHKVSMHAGPQESQAMCKPAGTEAGEGMQCKAGSGQMSCCENCPCMDKMKKNKETP